MKSKLTALLSVATFIMFLVIGCESPNEPLTTKGQTSTVSEATTLAKGKNSRGGNNERSCYNKSHHDNEHGNNGVCVDDNDEEDNEYNCNDNNNSTCDADGIVTLWAGKTINAGTATITQNANTLYVTYATTGSWKIREAHLDISTSAYTQRGAPGQYDYQYTNNNGVTTYTFTVPITWVPGTKIYFLAHAVVGKYSTSSCGSTETAYGGTVVKPRNGSWFATFCTTINNTTPPPTYSINGVAFVDANSNGIQDSGEAGLANTTVSLNTGASTTTNASGQYSFSGLVAGSYTVTGGAVTGYNQTTAASAVVVLTNANGSANFGYALIPPPTYTISGYTYFDTNGNGVQDSGEPPLANVPISINVGGTVLTDANGMYSFSGLTPDTYSIIPGLVSGLNITSAPSAKVIISGANGSASFGYNDAPIPLRVTGAPKKP